MSGRLLVSGPFFEKTGNPPADNAARNTNRSIHRRTRETIRIQARSRKRARKLFHIEVDRYQHLVASVMNELIRNRTAEQFGEDQ